MTGELPSGESGSANSADRPVLLPDANAKVLHSVDLFGNLRMIWIEHAGSYYRLSITSRGKLILQK
ncbi:MAG: hemin uptake protein HemP [Planctomycetaceae bacterium]|nr:hemin uptake protein HemP [Planctomycetaceae bacterium]